MEILFRNERIPEILGITGGKTLQSNALKAMNASAQSLNNREHTHTHSNGNFGTEPVHLTAAAKPTHIQVQLLIGCLNMLV